MRALKLRGPRDPVIVDTKEPSPAPGEVLVRIAACGVCGSDLNAWRGIEGIDYPLSPGAPGHETLGTIAAIGSGVSNLTVGDRVTGLLWPGFAELGVTAAVNLVTVPDRLANETVLGEPLACAMNVVRRSGLEAGDRFAVVGFGYLAALIVQLLPGDVGGWVAVSRREDSRQLAM